MGGSCAGCGEKPVDGAVPRRWRSGASRGPASGAHEGSQGACCSARMASFHRDSNSTDRARNGLIRYPSGTTAVPVRGRGHCYSKRCSGITRCALVQNYGPSEQARVRLSVFPRRRISSKVRGRATTQLSMMPRCGPLLAWRKLSHGCADSSSRSPFALVLYRASCPTQRRETNPFPLQPEFTPPNSPS
jgi:hypothetical protein